MGAMKAWAMSPAGVYAAERGVELAQARFDNVCAAAALAAPHVDVATLDEITFVASRELGEAYEVLAMCRGYGTAADMY